MITDVGRYMRIAVLASWREMLVYISYTLLFCVSIVEFDWHMFRISVIPVTLLGTVVSLMLGFRNNSAYDRWWEARKIWGAITNTSRNFGAQVMSFPVAGIDTVNTEELHEIQSRIMNRHIAYLNMLRMQLRGQTDMEEVKQHLPADDWAQIKDTHNKATQINVIQTKELVNLKASGALSEYSFVALTDNIRALYDCQGAAERIRNTPFPKVYDYCTRILFWIFLALLPATLIEHFGYRTILFTWLIAFVFVEVLKVGVIMQDPFSNQPNDTPLSAICRNIEIDLKEMLKETRIPEVLRPHNGALM